MKNKLGLNEMDILDVEEALLAYKASILNEKVSFNEDNFNLNYLLKLHKFLLGDIYYYAGSISNRYDEEDWKYINSLVEDTVFLIENRSQDIDNILSNIKELIDMQILKAETKEHCWYFYILLLTHIDIVIRIIITV